MGIWGGVERLSYRETPVQHSGRRVSTLTVRHGDAASVAELKGVRVPLFLKREEIRCGAGGTAPPS